MRYSLFHSSGLEFSSTWENCPRSSPSLSPGQSHSLGTGHAALHTTLTLECGSEREACVNSTILITWHGLCLLPARVSVVMAKAWDRGLPGDEKCFICILAVREGSPSASSPAFHHSAEGPASPTWMVQYVPGTRDAGNQICGQEPTVLIPWKWKTSCFDHLGDQPPLLKANPTLAGTASPPPKSYSPWALAWVSG